MTEETRRAIWEAASKRPNRPVGRAPRATIPATLSVDQAREDLRDLRLALEGRYSYLKTKGVNLDQLFAAANAAVSAGLSRNAFARVVARLLAPFGDGHSRVQESPAVLHDEGYAPFLLGDCGGGRVAVFHPDRSAFLSDAHPYLESIDGVALEDWLEAAAKDVADGSPQFVRRQSLRHLRHIEQVRATLSLERRVPLRLELRAENGRERKEVELPVSPERSTYGNWPRTDTRRLDGSIGYLRIPRMDDEPAFLRAGAAGVRSRREPSRSWPGSSGRSGNCPKVSSATGTTS